MNASRFSCFIVTALLYSTGAYAGDWIADANGCQVWNQAPEPGETITWSGACPNKKASGHGVLQWYVNGKAGSRHEGEYRDGMANGKGNYVHESGYRYVGDYVNDKYHGKGVFTFPASDTRLRYEGDFREGRLNGTGVFQWANGDRYEGGYRNQKQHGKGVMTMPDGYRYEGDWVDGAMTGKGVMKLANGDRYEGNFADNKRNGKGIELTSSGFRYDGYFVNDKRNGKGSNVDPDGTRYEGDWVDDKSHGYGVYVAADGMRYEGGFADGEPSGKGIQVSKHGRYDGMWLNGNRHGYGVAVYADGDRYEGNWENGRRTGATVFERQRAEQQAARARDGDDGGKLFASLLGAAIIASAPSSSLSSSEKFRMATGLISDIHGNTQGQGIQAAAHDIQSGRAAAAQSAATMAAMTQSANQPARNAAPGTRSGAGPAPGTRNGAGPTPAAPAGRQSSQNSQYAQAAQVAQPSVANNGSRAAPSGAGRGLHEVEEDWSAYRSNGWTLLVRGDHMGSREASCSDGQAKAANTLARLKAGDERPRQQSPCVCTKWWPDDRAVPGKWQCAIYGLYSGRGTASER